MDNQPKVALLGEQVIGQISSYAALPAAMCPRCGVKLHRLYNTQSNWKYVCLKENILVSPGTDDPPVQVQIE